MENNKELVSKLLENGVQFGHKTAKFHPNMNPYVWGVRNGMHLIDLNKTAFLLNHASEQIQKAASLGAQILWIGTKKQAQKVISEVASELKQPYVIHRWIGGTLTNNDQIKKAVTKLLHMRDVVAKPLPHMKKKQISMISKDLERLEKNVSGIIKLKPKPDLLVVVDLKRELTAIKEANMCGVPVICIADTNAQVSLVNTVIPANDDSQKSLDFVIRHLGEAAKRGYDAFKETNPEAFAKSQENSERPQRTFEERRAPSANKPAGNRRFGPNNGAGAARRPAPGAPRKPAAK